MKEMNSENITMVSDEELEQVSGGSDAEGDRRKESPDLPTLKKHIVPFEWAASAGKPLDL